MSHHMSGVVLGAVSPDCKPVVVGLDFGTSYSGISFSYRGDPSSIRCGAPTARDVDQLKVPTALVLKEDGKTWLFGYDAEDYYNEVLMNYYTAAGDTDKSSAATKVPVKMFKRFKMALNGQLNGFDTLKAVSEGGCRYSLMSLITESLRFLKEYALQQLLQGYGGTMNLDIHSDIMWVLTVPAIWNDFGKAFMRKAAFHAGLTNYELSDNLVFVLEPEGAAIAIHAGATLVGGAGFTSVGEKFLILDCGGGTVDITAYEVFNSSPLSMGSIAIPTGGPWGGEYVNDEFRKFLCRLLGEECMKDGKLACEFYKLNSDFDKLKNNFDPNKETTISISLRDVMDDVKELEGLAISYNRSYESKQIIINGRLRNGFLTFSKELMLSFFETILEKTCNETHKVIVKHPGIKTILLVGGFGSSKVLIDSIQKRFEKDNIKIIAGTTNPRPQAAIAHGAVYYGIYYRSVISRVAAYTYGISRHGDIFDKIITIGDLLPIDHVVNTTGIPVTLDQTTMMWQILRSDEINPQKASSAITLGTVKCPCPTNRSTKDCSDKEQTAILRFGGTEIIVEITNSMNEKVRGEIAMK